MAEKGAPLGNNNAGDGKIWRAAIRAALDRRSKCRTDGKAELDALADKLIDACLEGQIPAMREFGDRIEGKASQGIELTGKDGGPFVVEVLRFAATDS